MDSELLSFISSIPSVRLIVVVGGADEHLPSLPSTPGVKFVSYLKLLGQRSIGHIHSNRQHWYNLIVIW
ncbi:hypothetical protein J1N35_023863 [Gossypium stocksii]|uniref:Uncharacterized protein n=1 Tax=Gossypium stocksii TaxID=47602 RepID=A0A9D3VKS7_9ROSI|nr:hypothetical protein J1N35_023863 [Gossypium stocksii]